MKRILKSLGWAALILLILVLLAGIGFSSPVRIAFEIAFGWAGFLGRVVPKIQVNPAAVGFFLAVTSLVVGATHWLGRSLSTPQGIRWPWRWSLGLYVSLWLLFLTAMGVTGVAHQAGWLWRSDEPWEIERNAGWRSRMEMRGIARMIEIAVQEQAQDRDPDVSDIRADVIRGSSRSLDSCSFQLFPPDAGPFRAAIVRPRSQESLDRYGFVLVRRVGRIAEHMNLKPEELDPALEALTAGLEYKPAAERAEPGGPGR